MHIGGKQSSGEIEELQDNYTLLHVLVCASIFATKSRFERSDIHIEAYKSFSDEYFHTNGYGITFDIQMLFVGSQLCIECDRSAATSDLNSRCHFYADHTPLRWADVHEQLELM